MYSERVLRRGGLATNYVVSPLKLVRSSGEIVRNKTLWYLLSFMDTATQEQSGNSGTGLSVSAYQRIIIVLGICVLGEVGLLLVFAIVNLIVTRDIGSVVFLAVEGIGVGWPLFTLIRSSKTQNSIVDGGEKIATPSREFIPVARNFAVFLIALPMLFLPDTVRRLSRNKKGPGKVSGKVPDWFAPWLMLNLVLCYALAAWGDHKLSLF